MARSAILPFSSVSASPTGQDKRYDQMTSQQKRWADVLRRPQEEADGLCGTPWDQVKWDCHYLFAYAFVPPAGREFNPAGIEPIGNASLLSISHFWMFNNQHRRSEGLDPEVGIAARLYRTTYDVEDNEVVFGYNGLSDDDANNSSIFAKNLAHMPYSGGHGPVMDPVKTPELFRHSLELEEACLIAATEAGRDVLVEQPAFPSCLFGFSPDRKVPGGDEADQRILQQAALTYISEDGSPNGEYLPPLAYKGNKPTKLAATTQKPNGIIVLTTEDGSEVLLPSNVELRVSAGSDVLPGTVLGDYVVDDPGAILFANNPWKALVEEVGEFSATWLLDATMTAATTTHRHEGRDLVLVPAILVPKWASQSVEKFIDLRGDLGRTYRSVGAPDTDVFRANECRIHVCKTRQPCCAENLMFTGLGFRADLGSLRTYWDKHFRPGRAPSRLRAIG